MLVWFARRLTVPHKFKCVLILLIPPLFLSPAVRARGMLPTWNDFKHYQWIAAFVATAKKTRFLLKVSWVGNASHRQTHWIPFGRTLPFTSNTSLGFPHVSLDHVVTVDCAAPGSFSFVFVRQAGVFGDPVPWDRLASRASAA